MQTFMPYPSYRDSARTLDRQRLGKQRVECLQIARALLHGGGWSSSPAARMWRGHGAALCAYGMVICEEWKSRGYRDTCLEKLRDLYSEMLAAGESNKLPPWMGDDAVHESHRSNLVRKMPEHYGPLFPGVADDLEYVWPITTHDLTSKRKRGSVPRVAAGSTGAPSPTAKEPTVAARNTSRKTKAKAAPEPEVEDDDLDDIEADDVDTEDEIEEAPAPKPAKRAKAKGKAAKAEPVEVEVDTDEDEDDEEPAPAPKRKGKGKGGKAEAAAKAPKNDAPKFGTAQLAEHVNEKLGTSYTPFQLRAILRRMAKDDNSSLERVVGETRERYSFSGPTDPLVKELIKRLRSGEIERDKKEQLDKLKERNAAKKAKKAPEPEVEDLDDDEETDDDDE